MKIALDRSQSRLALLEGGALVFYDVSGSAAQKLHEVKVAQGRRVGSCDSYVAVLAGKLAPAGASVASAKVLRFSWDGSELAALPVGEVDKCGLSLSADGTRLVLTDWRSCRVTLFDTAGGAKLGAAGESIPSGASISPDGKRIICGTADQGSGAILAFDPSAIADGKMAMEKLKAPKPSPGLDDAPYFSVWSDDGTLVAISNQSWGGRGIFVYDGLTKAPLWSVSLEPGEEEEEEDAEGWYPMPLSFSRDASLLFAAEAGAIRAYRARSGENLGSIAAANGDGSAGFCVQSAQKRLWLAGAKPVALSMDERWLNPPAEKKSASKTAAKKSPAKKSPAKKSAKKSGV